MQKPARDLHEDVSEQTQLKEGIKERRKEDLSRKKKKQTDGR